MSTGKTVRKLISRVASHPPIRGQSFAVNARTNPSPAKKSRFDSGASQTKCRLIKYPRVVGTRFLTQIVVTTSINPPARPHQADRIRTSSGRSLGRKSRAWVDLEESLRSAGVVVLIKPIPNAAEPQPNRMSKNGVLPSERGWKRPYPERERNRRRCRASFTKFTNLIVAVLSCFDRVIFKGHLPIVNGKALKLMPTETLLTWFFGSIPRTLGLPLAKLTRNDPDVRSFRGVLSPRKERACDRTIFSRCISMLTYLLKEEGLGIATGQELNQSRKRESEGMPGDHRRVTTVVRPWFERGTSNLARKCDRPQIGLTPEVGGLRPVRTTHSRAWSWGTTTFPMTCSYLGRFMRDERALRLGASDRLVCDRSGE